MKSTTTEIVRSSGKNKSPDRKMYGETIFETRRVKYFGFFLSTRWLINAVAIYCLDCACVCVCSARIFMQIKNPVTQWLWCTAKNLILISLLADIYYGLAVSAQERIYAHRVRRATTRIISSGNKNSKNKIVRNVWSRALITLNLNPGTTTITAAAAVVTTRWGASGRFIALLIRSGTGGINMPHTL